MTCGLGSTSITVFVPGATVTPDGDAAVISAAAVVVRDVRAVISGWLAAELKMARTRSAPASVLVGTVKLCWPMVNLVVAKVALPNPLPAWILPRRCPGKARLG